MEKGIFDNTDLRMPTGKTEVKQEREGSVYSVLF